MTVVSLGETDANTLQMFLGNERKVYIIDKTENNPIQISGRYGTHPAWAVEYDIYDRTCKCTHTQSMGRLS